MIPLVLDSLVRMPLGRPREEVASLSGGGNSSKSFKNHVQESPLLESFLRGGAQKIKKVVEDTGITNLLIGCVYRSRGFGHLFSCRKSLARD
ncbi:hypothetical protein DMENIID0001_070230 [Sergentomyia squamirostris]